LDETTSEYSKESLLWRIAGKKKKRSTKPTASLIAGIYKEDDQ